MLHPEPNVKSSERQRHPHLQSRAAQILVELFESHVSDMLVVLEVVEAGDLLASNRDIIECQVQDLRIR